MAQGPQAGADAEHVFAAIARMRNVLFRHAGAPVRAAGLTVPQFEVLEALSSRGPLSVGQVTRTVFGTPGNIPVVVRNLERDGLVERSRCASDGRVSVIALTSEGSERVRAVYPQVVESIERDLAALSPREKTQLNALLRKAFDTAAAADGR